MLDVEVWNFSARWARQDFPAHPPPLALALLRLRMAIALIPQHQAEQAIHDAGIGVRAADRYIRHDANVAFTDDLHQLHYRVALRAERIHADAIRFGFRLACRSNRLSFAERS